MKQIHTDKPLPWNGGNAPTCPECGSGNAMLTYHGRPKHDHDVQCRDCGLIVLVTPSAGYSPAALRYLWNNTPVRKREP